MSVLNNSLLLGADAGAAGGYQISRSLRFNSADSAYLSKVFSSSGNRKTWTWSGWVKRSKLAVSDFELFSGGSSADQIRFSDDNGGNSLRIIAAGGSVITSQLFRDTFSWYHIVVAVDTSQATSSDRIKLYINGAQVTAFFSATYPALNENTVFNSATAHNLGAMNGNYGFFDGYLADIHFIDGQALTPSAFGQFDANNVWQPKAYSGPTPTGNSFWLPFSDNSAATATTLGKDGFNLGNNWTPNNLSVTAGSGNDSLVDTPSSGSQVDTGLGGEVTGNYATLNPLDKASATTLANGNLDYSTSGAGGVRSTIGMSSGKYYAEVTVGHTSLTLGIATGGTALNNYLGANSGEYGYGQNGYKLSSAGQFPYGNTFTTGDVIGIAFDADIGSLYFYKNGTIQNSGTAAFTGLTSGPYFFAISNNVTTSTCNVNFGQRPFAYAAPSGFKALCTTNLPTPTIANGATAMDVKLYTGNGSTQTISGLGFSPDLVWVKGRSFAEYHGLFDTVRGTGKVLFSNATDAENSYTASTQNLTAFNSDGFSLGTDGPLGTNRSSTTYAAWCWDAGSSTVTNTAGSITSQVRANPSAGFSVVTYTGTGAAATVGHGLGAAPKFFVVKRRDSSASWIAWHGGIGPTDILRLESTNAKQTIAGFWQGTNPTSTLIYLDADGTVNGSGGTYVAYCFAPVAGFSAFGSYTGNGSADGPFVYTGFRPRWILYKRSDAGTGSGNWNLVDTARSAYNVSQTEVIANDSIAEFTSSNASMDILSNGFKIRTTDTSRNESAKTFIYAAFAESPFAYSRAR